MDAVKTHNPFALNDILFSRQTGFPLEKMNNYGCSLVWGHPQAPMATRAVIELIEELAERGGGYGLFAGCAAGDSAMAVVLEVTDDHDAVSDIRHARQFATFCRTAPVYVRRNWSALSILTGPAPIPYKSMTRSRSKTR